jgi:hypothetical protein
MKRLPLRGLRGHDAAKRAVVHTRVALVDADGNWLAVAVVSASTPERDTVSARERGHDGMTEPAPRYP